MINAIQILQQELYKLDDYVKGGWIKDAIDLRNELVKAIKILENE